MALANVSVGGIYTLSGAALLSIARNRPHMSHLRDVVSSRVPALSFPHVGAKAWQHACLSGQLKAGKIQAMGGSSVLMVLARGNNVYRSSNQSCVMAICARFVCASQRCMRFGFKSLGSGMQSLDRWRANPGAVRRGTFSGRY